MVKSQKKNRPSAQPQVRKKDFFPSHGEDGFFSSGEKEGFFSSERSSAFSDVQPKLTIGKANDPYEKEADTVADKVIQSKEEPGNTSRHLNLPNISMIQADFFGGNEEVQQQAEEEEVQEKQDELALQRKTFLPDTPPEGEIQKKGSEGEESQTNGLESQLANSKGQGSMMADTTRSSMESGFGRDFSQVRIHTSDSAVQMSRSLGAQAFTHGNDIYFNQGKYNPGTPSGQHLLAHELTHTIQQGEDVQKKNIQRTEGEATAGAPQEETSVQSATFNPSPQVAEYIQQAGRRGTNVRVRFGNIASGEIKVKKNQNEKYETDTRRQGIPLNIPFLQPLRDAGVTPVLAVQIQEDTISGFVSVQVGGNVAPNVAQLLNWIKDHPREMSWIGLSNIRMPGTVTNEIQNGELHLQISGVAVKIGGFLDATADLGLVNTNVTFSGRGTLNIPRLEPTQFSFSRDAEGKLSGEVEAAVTIANFNGRIRAKYENGVLDIQGTIGYSTEKLSGEVTLLVTDEQTARSVTRQGLSQEQIIQSAQEASGAGGPEATPSTSPRALAGYGELDFRLTEWFTGKAHVAINNLGQVTIVGSITPPAEIELFPQRDYIKNLFTFEVRTLYGVPLVGNVFLFANIGMDALAKLGPGKIYNIRIDGTFSTDPEVLNSFSIQASLNISAFAGLRLRAEGGVGVELLGHDIKAGVGVNALAGIRGYVEATPTIGYREVASPEAGRQGEFYIHGHMEIAAQPFLGLGGDLFVELDSPWWSPAPDKKWTWPLGELEYPLPGEFGIGADVDYVIGSGELPEIEFGEVDFNKDKFMTDLMNDHVPPKQSADDERQGEFTEEPQGGGAQDPQMVDSEGNPNAGQPAQGQQTGEEQQQQPTQEVMQRWGRGMQALGELAQQSERDPKTRAEITAALDRLKREHGFTRLDARAAGAMWNVNAEMPNINNRNNPLTVKGDIQPGDETIEGEGVEREEIIRNIEGVNFPFSMNGESHNLYFVETNGKVELEMASGLRERLIAKINAALDETKDKRGLKWMNIHGELLELRHKLTDYEHDFTAIADGYSDRTIESLRAEIRQVGQTLQNIGNQNHVESIRDMGHESDYVNPDDQIDLTHPAFSGKTLGDAIRDVLYGDWASHVDNWKSTRLSADFGQGDGLKDPTNPSNFISEMSNIERSEFERKTINGQHVVSVPKSQASIDHVIPVAQHWNDTGNNLQQSPRVTWYSNTTGGNLKIISGPLNSSLGARGHNYEPDVGPNFRGPNE